MVCLQHLSVRSPVSSKPAYPGWVAWHIAVLLKVIAPSGEEEGPDQFLPYLPIHKSNAVTKGICDASVWAALRLSVAQQSGSFFACEVVLLLSFIISFYTQGRLKDPNAHQGREIYDLVCLWGKLTCCTLAGKVSRASPRPAEVPQAIFPGPRILGRSICSLGQACVESLVWHVFSLNSRSSISQTAKFSVRNLNFFFVKDGHIHSSVTPVNLAGTLIIS